MKIDLSTQSKEGYICEKIIMVHVVIRAIWIVIGEPRVRQARLSGTSKP